MWADNEADLDLLGYDYLVDGLIVALTEPRLLPLTVGVLGDWGSGKSSLLSLAAKELDEIRATSEGASEGEARGPAYLTIEFSPWQHEDYDDVKVALMTAVLDALEEQMPEAAAEVGRLRTFVTGLKRWGRRTGRAGATLTPAAVPVLLHATVPGLDPGVSAIITTAAGAAANEATAALAETAETEAKAADRNRVPPGDITTFRKEFGELVAALPCDAVVVFIDDLDRCLPETIVDTFEAIRLFLNTPKTAYVLALNQGVVESAVDSRYPELKKPDGAGIGRDYLEKMLQLKVAIPPLSAPEAETFVNLLFAELHLDEHAFKKALATADENRRAGGLSVAFNAGIAGDVLDDIPADLARDLAWAAEITPILGSSLRGNPRQLKRFLNNLLLKHRSAARRKVELELPILAKLMVLEDQYNTDFQKLFDWEVVAGGKCPEMTTAESRARAGDGQATVAAVRDGDAKPKKKAAAPSIPAAPGEAEVWADKPHIADWLRAEPSLKGIDLRAYFTYSRDKLSFGVSASRLAPHLQQLLVQAQSEIEANRRSHYPSVAALEPSERAQFIEALLERIQRYPAGPALPAALELAELNTDIVQAVCQALIRIPPASIPTSAGSTTVRRLPPADPAVIALLDHWQTSENASLKSLITTARQAQAKKGGTRGNLS